LKSNPQTTAEQLTDPALTFKPSSWVEVSRSALRHNFDAIQMHVGRDVRVCPVIKSDAYGHGAAGCAAALRDAGTAWFAVSTAEEGAALRRGGIRERILVLSGFWRGEEEEIVRHQLTPAIWDRRHVEDLENAAARKTPGQRVAVHLKINTGMNRLGADKCDLPAIYHALRASPHISFEGLFSHFASSEVIDHPHGEEQLRQFSEAVAQARNLGFEPRICHMANSAAIATRPASWFNLVRPGLLIYGHCLPLTSTQQSALSNQPSPQHKLSLQPAITWKTRVLQVREVIAGEQVGYSAGYIAKSTTKVAVLAVGYGDGLSRRLSSRGRMILHNAYAPIIGNISMNLTAVDATEISGVSVGDEATIIGATSSCKINVWEHADLAETIPYEILCNISSRLPRKYVE
jgi:alanine racemase